MAAPARSGRLARLAAAAAAVFLLHPVGAPAVNADGIAMETSTLPHLRWLARNQRGDGGWGSPWGPQADRVRLTGMALLNFLGAGYTHLSRDTHDGMCFGQAVKGGLKRLTEGQDEDGNLAPAAAPLDAHLWGAFALSEAYGLTASGLFKGSAAKAVAWLESQQREDGGWGDGETPDPMLTARAAIVLHSARISGLTASEARADATRRALERIVIDDPDTPDGATALAAVRLTILLLRNRRDPEREGPVAERLRRILSSTDPPVPPPELAWWSSQALRQMDGPAGDTWSVESVRLRRALRPLQRKDADGDFQGSWDPPPFGRGARESRPLGIPPELHREARPLVRQLGDERFGVREEASLALCRLGPRALPLVREALSAPEAEVAARAAAIARELAGPASDIARIEATCLYGMTLFELYR